MNNSIVTNKSGMRSQFSAGQNESNWLDGRKHIWNREDVRVVHAKLQVILICISRHTL